MSGRVDGKVAFITGAARGLCRTHAVRAAEEGAGTAGGDDAEPGFVYFQGAVLDQARAPSGLAPGYGRPAQAWR
jgi:NAD(P)-dependent dehydrogenase (short-subunit alcohol dehydrogenase family)